MHFPTIIPLFKLGKTSLYWHPWCFFQNGNNSSNLGNSCNDKGIPAIQSQHRVAVQALFAASAEDLDATYRPGRTEVSK